MLDEVQMLGDKGRGWSWTRVLLGLPAAQLHLCGDPAAADLLGELASSCGDQLTVKRYRCAVVACALSWQDCQTTTAHHAAVRHGGDDHHGLPDSSR